MPAKGSAVCAPFELVSPWLKKKEAAEYLRISERTLLNWETEGLISPGSTPGGHQRFHKDDLDKFLRANRRRKGRGRKVR